MGGMNMKTIKTIIAAALLLAGISMTQSCLKDQHDYFDTKPTERMQKYLSDVKTLLTKPENGWRMEYFIGNADGDYGGRNLAMVFGKDVDSVRVYSEEYGSTSFKSFYKLTTDDGPVLAFDTYNTIMHKYGTANSNYYEGKGGDYEFLIIAYDDKSITLKGKRSGKMCMMYPLEEPAIDFATRMYNLSRDFKVSSFAGKLDGKDVAGELDLRNRQFTISEMYVAPDGQLDAKESFTQPYILTDKGVKFYEPLEFFGVSYTDMNFASADTTFTSAQNPALKLKGQIPLDWLPYDFFAGDYMFTYGDGAMSITLIPEVEGETYRAKGFSDDFDLIFDYDIIKGRIQLKFQLVCKPDTDEVVEYDKCYVCLLPWDLADGGSLWMNSDLGMDAVWQISSGKEKPLFNWKDNKAIRSFATDSFILYLYNPSPTADSSYGGEASAFKFKGGNSRLANLKTMKKK